MMFKRTLLAGLAALTCGLSLQGCDNTAVAVGAGVVGGAIVTGAIYDYNYGYYNRPYYRSCYSRYDGYYYCRNNNGWYRWNRWHYNDTVAAMNLESTANVEMTKGNVSSATAMVKKYALSTYAAQSFIQAYEGMRANGSTENLNALGLSNQDLQRMSKGQPASTAAIQTVAATLKTSTRSVSRLLHDLTSEYSLQQQHGWKL